MKSLNIATALLIAATMITGVGCKRTPVKPPTPIPGYPASQVGTPTDGGGPVRPPNTGGGNTTTPGGTLPTDGGATPGGLPNNTGTTGQNLPRIDPGEAVKPGERPDGEENREILAAETVLFDFDRNTVKPSEVPKVQRVAAYMKNNADVSLRVEGNCDERGTEEYNRSLGERRALAVRELLVSEGVAPERVTTLSYGEDKPADPGHDEIAWQKNRRADFVVIKPRAIQ